MFRRFAVVAVIAYLVVGCGSVRAAGPHTITLTLVRHAQSGGNASGLIDTSVPGPELTAKGWCQATAAADQLSPNHYDGVYASSLIRAQQTATPTAQALGKPVNILPGLREIEAGQYEGQPEFNAQNYLAAPLRWLQGDRSAKIPGSLDGNEFESRFNDAVRQIYESGDHVVGADERSQLRPVTLNRKAAAEHWPRDCHGKPHRGLDIDRVGCRSPAVLTVVECERQSPFDSRRARPPVPFRIWILGHLADVWPTQVRRGHFV
jgi:broad specificity phosphatase PhoE